MLLVTTIITAVSIKSFVLYLWLWSFHLSYWILSSELRHYSAHSETAAFKLNMRVLFLSLNRFFSWWHFYETMLWTLCKEFIRAIKALFSAVSTNLTAKQTDKHPHILYSVVGEAPLLRWAKTKTLCSLFSVQQNSNVSYIIILSFSEINAEYQSPNIQH